jgi:hypothetical protein
MTEEGKPGRAAGAWIWTVMPGENAANNVFVDIEPERKGNLLRNPSAAILRVPPLHFNDRGDEFCR